jgi:hypothetical protein
MKIISYTDPNGKKCYADVSQFACIMTEHNPPRHDMPPPEHEWLTKVVLSHRAGYILATEDCDTMCRKIQNALGVDWSDV